MPFPIPVGLQQPTIVEGNKENVEDCLSFSLLKEQLLRLSWLLPPEAVEKLRLCPYWRESLAPTTGSDSSHQSLRLVEGWGSIRRGDSDETTPMKNISHDFWNTTNIPFWSLMNSTNIVQVESKESLGGIAVTLYIESSITAETLPRVWGCSFPFGVVPMSPQTYYARLTFYLWAEPKSRMLLTTSVDISDENTPWHSIICQTMSLSCGPKDAYTATLRW